ncbi:MAG: alginate export family protein [PVC group bacterium]|nr:alginate export family protein [PVC group bacterium]
MKRFLTVLCALSIVALMAMPALAEVQNIKLGGSIGIRGFYRDNTGAATFADTTSADFYNSYTTIDVAADLTDNVAANVSLINERDWGVTSTNVTSNRAYITLKEMLYSPLTIKAGRMPVVLADGLMVGDGTATTLTYDNYSIQNEFDTIHGILDYDPLTLVIGTLKLVEGINGAALNGGDVDGYLIDAIYKLDDYQAVLDTYLVAAHYDSPAVGLLNGPANNSTQGTDIYGLATRLTMEVSEGVGLDAGIGYQFGDYMKTATQSRDLKAYAIQLGLDYAIEAEYSPKVGVKYLYLSGDDLAGNGDFKGWLPLVEGQINGVIIDANTNTNSINLNASLVPMDRLTLDVDLWFFNLAKSRAAQTAALSTKKDVGTEIDIALKYAYTEDVSMGLTLAYFMPGDYYRNGFDKTAKEIIAEIGVKF